MYFYKVVTGKNPVELADKVNDLLREGWRLQGGVVVSAPGGVEVWAQVMVKK